MTFISSRTVCQAAALSALVLGPWAPNAHAGDWKGQLEKQLPTLGHRNWIVIADSAYPSQTAAGVQTVYAGGDQLSAVRHVLAAVDDAAHVRGHVFVDAELEHIDEQAAEGVTKYRSELSAFLTDRDVTKLPHEQIIQRLQKAGESFHILVIKTDLTLPYTSVFIRLDAGYWSDEAENSLRASMQSANGQ